MDSEEELRYHYAVNFVDATNVSVVHHWSRRSDKLTDFLVDLSHSESRNSYVNIEQPQKELLRVSKSVVNYF